MIKLIKVVPCSTKSQLFIQKNGDFLLNLNVENEEKKINEQVALFIAEVLKIDRSYIKVFESGIKQYKQVEIKKNYFKPKPKSK